MIASSCGLKEKSYIPLSDGQIDRPYCGGSLGTEAVLIFPINEIKSSVYLYSRGSYDKIFLWVTFEIPENYEFKLNSKEFLLSNDESGDKLILTLEYIKEAYPKYGTQDRFDKNKYQPTKLIIGKTYTADRSFLEDKILHSNWVSMATTELKGEKKLPNKIILRYPEILINGEKVKIKPIKFKLSNDWFMQNINC